MKHISLAQKILKSKKPFFFFHTWCVTKNLLQQAIAEEKSMDLDVCVDDKGNPYLGHSKEYHEKSGEPFFVTMPLWEAVDMIAKSSIPVMVDCKHFNAWPIIEEVVTKIGPERCLVCVYVSEFKFGYSRKENEPDFLTEWSPIKKLRLLKSKFPLVNTTPCAKWLRYFLAENIIPHIVVDKTDTIKLSELYIGETDYLKSASNSRFLRIERS